MMEMCVEYLKFGGHAHIFRSSVKFLSWVKVFSASTEHVTFKDAEDERQERSDAMFDQKKRCLVYVGDLQNVS